MFGVAFRGTLAGKGDFTMSNHPALTHLAAGEGKSLPIGKIGLLYRAGTLVGSPYAISEMSVPAGSNNPQHRHPWEETLYVLEGEFEMFGDDGERRLAGPGCVMHVPPRAAHGFNNVGKTPGRLLVVASAGQEAYFEDFAEAMVAAKDDPEAIARVRARHGAEAVGPAAKGR